MPAPLQKVRFQHPLYDTFFEMDLPWDLSFGEITKLLYREGFLKKKKCDYHYIIDDRLCSLNHTLQNYLPEPQPDPLDIKIHGLLTIMT